MDDRPILFFSWQKPIIQNDIEAKSKHGLDQFLFLFSFGFTWATFIDVRCLVNQICRKI